MKPFYFYYTLDSAQVLGENVCSEEKKYFSNGYEFMTNRPLVLGTWVFVTDMVI